MGGDKWVFYYDGDCGFCRAAVRLLARLDFGRRVQWTDFRGLTAPPPELSWGDLAAAAYLERPGTGQRYRGFYAFRMLTLRLPPLWVLTPPLWLPGTHWLGERAYQWVARNRYRISGCGRFFR